MTTSTFFAGGFRNFSTRRFRMGASYKALQGTAAVLALSGSERGCLINVEGATVPVLAIGRHREEVDNSAGATGALESEVDLHKMRECIRWKNSATSPLTDADVGSICFFEDNDTVAAADAEGVVAGVFWGFSQGMAMVEPVPASVSEAFDDSEAHRVYATFQKVAADGAANTATAETAFARVAEASTITSAHYVPSAALTANDTDNATITLRKRNGSGGAASAIASITTNVAGGGFTAFVSKTLGTLTGASLAAGTILTLEITKAGSGVAVPAGALVVGLTVDAG